MKKKIILSAILLLLSIVFFIIGDIVRYETHAEYSKLAVQQLNDDSAYPAMQSYRGVKYLSEVIYALIIILFGYIGYRIWFKKDEKG